MKAFSSNLTNRKIYNAYSRGEVEYKNLLLLFFAKFGIRKIYNAFSRGDVEKQFLHFLWVFEVKHEQ